MGLLVQLMCISRPAEGDHCVPQDQHQHVLGQQRQREVCFLLKVPRLSSGHFAYIKLDLESPGQCLMSPQAEHPQLLPPFGSCAFTSQRNRSGTRFVSVIRHYSNSSLTQPVPALKIDHLDLRERKPKEIKRGSDRENSGVSYWLKDGAFETSYKQSTMENRYLRGIYLTQKPHRVSGFEALAKGVHYFLSQGCVQFSPSTRVLKTTGDVA